LADDLTTVTIRLEGDDETDTGTLTVQGDIETLVLMMMLLTTAFGEVDDDNDAGDVEPGLAESA
jgi:hypothetical protein